MWFSKYYGGSKPKTEPTYNCRFDPKEDITSYELALIMRGFRGFCDPQDFKITKDKYDSLPPNVRRHFVQIVYKYHI